MMKLMVWLKQNKLSHKEFSKQIGVSKATVSRWINGHCKIKLITAEIIELYTKGAITVKDIYED